MLKEKIETKTFNMKMPKELWMFLKRTAADKEVSMTEIVNTCVEKYKKRLDSKTKTVE